MRRPWFRVWRDKWTGSSRIQQMNLEEKGFYWDMYIYCQDDPMGEFRHTSGKAMNIDEFARTIRVKKDKTKRLFHKLESLGLIKFDDVNQVWKVINYAELQAPLGHYEVLQNDRKSLVNPSQISSKSQDFHSQSIDNQQNEPRNRIQKEKEKEIQKKIKEKKEEERKESFSNFLPQKSSRTNHNRSTPIPIANIVNNLMDNLAQPPPPRTTPKPPKPPKITITQVPYTPPTEQEEFV